MFSLFGKKDRKRPESATNTALGRTVYPRDQNAAANGAQTRNDLQRRRQEEMTAKIDAIESEMVADFPPLGVPSLPRRATPVPSGVALPDDVKREPDSTQRGAPPDTVGLDESPSMLTADLESLSTDIFDDSLGTIEICDTGAGLPAAVEEAAIFYANGQNDECKRALRDEIANDGSTAIVWYLLFELMQQSGDQAGFDGLAMEFVLRFERSPPVWRGGQAVPGAAGTRKPLGQSYAVTLPAVLSARVDADLAAPRRALAGKARVNVSFDAVRSADEPGAEAVLAFLVEAQRGTAQVYLTGVSNAVERLGELPAADGLLPRAIWLLRLELFRLLRRDHEFEELSVEYAVAFEVSPPSFEPIPEHFLVDDRAVKREPGVVTDPRVAELRVLGPRLEGDLIGRAPEAVSVLEAAAAIADQIEIDCAALRRVDFAAAGNLLNWLVSAQGRGKHFAFIDVNQLVLALFRIMGIPSVAQITARRL